MNAKITRRPLSQAQAKFFYLIPNGNELFFASLSNGTMLVASRIGDCYGLQEQIAVPEEFADLLKIASVPLAVAVREREIEYTCDNHHGRVMRSFAPQAILRFPEDAREIDGERLTRAIHLALDAIPSLDDQVMFYISPEEVVATDRVLLAVVQHGIQIDETIFVLPTHAASISPLVSKYSVSEGWWLLAGNDVVYNIPQVQRKGFDTSIFDAPPQFTVSRQDMSVAIGVIKALTPEPHIASMEIKDGEIIIATAHGDNHGKTAIDIVAISPTIEKNRKLLYSAYYLSRILSALHSATMLSCAVYGDNDLLVIATETENMRVRYVLPPIRFNQ